MFKVIRQYIGPLEPRSRVVLEFPYENLNVIHMQASCGCTDPRTDPVRQVVTVTFEAPGIPPHLVQEKKNTVTTNKTITVKYVDKDDPYEKDGKTTKVKLETLIFTATIVDTKLNFN